MYAPRRYDSDSEDDAAYDSPARAEVLAALAEDACCRTPGVTAGLYGLGELAPFARLGHGIPVLRHTRNWHKRRPVRFERAADDAEFRRRLRRAAPFLENFDLKRHGLCLAGGAASALLMRSDADLEGDSGVYHDYDLFLVGHPTDEAARAAIQALRHHLYEQWGGEGRVEVYRSQGCITFHSRDPRYPPAPTPHEGAEALDAKAALDAAIRDGLAEVRHEAEKTTYARRGPATGEELRSGATPEALGLADQEEPAPPEALGLADQEEPAPPRGQLLVQVVLRRYSTAAEVIHGFDLGSSAALWDGEALRVTALGKMAFEHGANVLNLSARRNSYERRLARYFQRGFDLVLPDLNGLELLKAEGRLPYLYVSFSRHQRWNQCACDLWARYLSATRPEHDDCGRAPGAANWGTPPAETSDYSAGSVAYGDKLQLALRNARALGAPEVWVESLCARAPLTPGLDIFGIEPGVDAEELTTLALRTFRPSGVHLKTLTACLGCDGAAELTLGYLGGLGRIPDRAEVAEIAARRCLALRARAHIPFAFMTVKDRTALTTPYAGCHLTAPQWYGSAWYSGR